MATTVAPNRDFNPGATRVPDTSQHLLTRSVEILPPAPLLHHRLQILQPNHAILHRVLDDRAGEAGSDVIGAEDAVAVVGGGGEATWVRAPWLPGRPRGLRRALRAGSTARIVEAGDGLFRGLVSCFLHGCSVGGRPRRPSSTTTHLHFSSSASCPGSGR